MFRTRICFFCCLTHQGLLVCCAVFVLLSSMIFVLLIIFFTVFMTSVGLVESSYAVSTLMDWAKHPALTNLIYIAQLTHWSACVKDLNEERLALPRPIRLRPYEVSNFGLRSYLFCFLFYRKHQSIFFLFSFETCNKTMRREK